MEPTKVIFAEIISSLRMTTSCLKITCKVFVYKGFPSFFQISCSKQTLDLIFAVY